MSSLQQIPRPTCTVPIQGLEHDGHIKDPGDRVRQLAHFETTCYGPQRSIRKAFAQCRAGAIHERHPRGCRHSWQHTSRSRLGRSCRACGKNVLIPALGPPNATASHRHNGPPHFEYEAIIRPDGLRTTARNSYGRYPATCGTKSESFTKGSTQ